MPVSADKACSGAQYALFLALDGQPEASIKQIREVFSSLRLLKVSGRFDIRSITICRVLCAVAECANGRGTNADRILGTLTDGDVIERLAVNIARCILRELHNAGACDWEEIQRLIQSLAESGYCDIARLLVAVSRELRSRSESIKTHAVLTTSEREVLRLLADGLVPKEIAAETRRSVHTIRVHIANAIQKLECHGQAAAIRSARRLGLI